MKVVSLDNVTLNTSGTSLWSDCESLDVRIIGLGLTNRSTLKVFFDLDDWDTEHQGYIYTDIGFKEDFKRLLNNMNLPNNVDYSEYADQGDSFVTFEVDKNFSEKFNKMFDSLD
jgi:hypothetical protein